MKDKEVEFQKVDFEIEGLSDISLDPFQGHDSTSSEQKLKSISNDKGNLVIKRKNLLGFLVSSNSRASCATTFEHKKGKSFSQEGKASIFFDDSEFELLDENNKPIKAELSNKVQNEEIVMNNKNIRALKYVITIKKPWKLKSSLTLMENPSIKMDRLKNWFEMGGLVVALGTLRPSNGRFLLSKWETK